MPVKNINQWSSLLPVQLSLYFHDASCSRPVSHVEPCEKGNSPGPPEPVSYNNLHDWAIKHAYATWGPLQTTLPHFPFIIMKMPSFPLPTELLRDVQQSPSQSPLSNEFYFWKTQNQVDRADKAQALEASNWPAEVHWVQSGQFIHNWHSNFSGHSCWPFRDMATCVC